ncbi:MAG: hypothetical protein K0U41_07630 [Gammaproteobacteria bacterium]|nr:hypothetical protein [Gammaproteobacteria bacterium]
MQNSLAGVLKGGGGAVCLSVGNWTTGDQLVTGHLMPVNYFILSVGAGLASWRH